MKQNLLQQAAELAEKYRESVSSKRVFPDITPDELRRRLAVSLTDEGVAAEEVLAELAAAAEPGLVASAGPRYFGFVIGGSLPVTTAADWLTSAWDQNAGLYATSPAASVAEEVAAAWLLDVLHLPETASVGFVTGGGTANFTCLAAARHEVLRRAGWDVEQNGLPGAPEINVVITDEAHATIFSALRLLGLGAARVKRVPTDEQGRMMASEFTRVLNSCSGPTIVSAQAGNVNTGSFDPLEEIIELAHKRDAWVHVDGAFGMWAAASDKLRHLARGAERADSWAVDGHKWLNVPYDCGLAICAHPAAHRGAMGISAAYLVQSKRERDNFDLTPEFSRRARGFTVYAALRHLGRKGVSDLIERGCARARQMAELLRKRPGVSILNDVVLNQVLVRFHDSDEATRAVIECVQKDGTCWLGGTTWHGMAAMRISVSNWSTSEKDAELSATSIAKAAASVKEPVGVR